MLSLLDRQLIKRCCTAQAIILLLGLALIIGIELVAQSNAYLRGDLPEGTSRFGLIVTYYCLRLPMLVDPLWPIASVGAAMLTLAPMIKRQEIIALGAAGISLKRIAAPIVLLSMLTGGILFIISDQVAPRLASQLAAIEDTLLDQQRHDRVWSDPNSSQWYATSVDLTNPQQPRLTGLIAHNAQHQLLRAGSLYFTDGQWVLADPVIIVDNQQIEQYDDISLPFQQWAISYTPQSLSAQLVSRQALTSWQLLQRSGQLETSIILSRFTRFVIPYLMTLLAVYMFLRVNRTEQLLLQAGKGFGLALVAPGLIYLGLSLIQRSNLPLFGFGIVWMI